MQDLVRQDIIGLHGDLSYINVRKEIAPSNVINPFELRFYSVAVITSGSDRHHLSGVGHPGDPGSIPGKTFPFALSIHLFCSPCAHLERCTYTDMHS